MALNNAALTTGSTAINNEITQMRLHSAAPDAGYTTNQIGSLVAVTGTVNTAGKITWSNIAFTGLPASSPVTHISYWTGAVTPVNRGGAALTGDAAANAAGEYTVTSVTETPTAT